MKKFIMAENNELTENVALEEGKKKKQRKQQGSLNNTGFTLRITTGDPDLNIAHFNKCAGTDFITDVAPAASGDISGTANSTGSSSGEAAATDGAASGGIGESMIPQQSPMTIDALKTKMEKAAASIEQKIDSLTENSENAQEQEEATASEDDQEWQKLKDRFQAIQRSVNLLKNAKLSEEDLTTYNSFIKDIMPLQESSNLTPVEKMQLFDQGKRRENVGACNDAKLVAYHKICVAQGYDNARRQLEAEMTKRGIAFVPPSQRPVPAQNKTRDLSSVIVEITPSARKCAHVVYNAPAAKNAEIYDEILDILLPDNAPALDCDTNIARIILGVICAIYFDKMWLVEELKALLIDAFNVNKDDLKKYIKALFDNLSFARDFNAMIQDIALPIDEDMDENMKINNLLAEAKREVKRYYIRPQNKFCANKEEILQRLAELGDENCSVYTLKHLTDHDDVHLLTPQDIIYYYDDGILYDKNHVKVMDYDLFVKNEEERKHFASVDSVSDAAFDKVYQDRLTEDFYDKLTMEEFQAKLLDGEEIYLGYNMDDAADYPIVDNEQYADTEYYAKIVDNSYILTAQVISHHGGEGAEWVNTYKSFDEFLNKIKELRLEDCPIDLIDSYATEAFSLNYKSKNMLGESWDDESFICCICGEESQGYGNNPEPYMPAEHGERCCDACNAHFVIPARLAYINIRRDEE